MSKKRKGISNQDLMIAGAVGAGAYVLSKARAASNLDVTPGLPKQLRVSLGQGQLTFLLPLNFWNRTATNINIQSLDLTVSINTATVGRAYRYEKFRINPSGQTQADAIVNIQLLDLISIIPEIRDLVQGKTIQFNFNGFVKAELLNFPVQFSQSIKIPRII
ncbi:hypothetical protein [Salmonirosea aquatica]|uniref:Late embryogenesis abundant protein LEA-2 subgroup domain-containing protein n=1 Tax=Salmonirosea aquatica TaxID=2654236 RepID=A0A7C9FFY9_9BACT|nr:hypothetical protein [Cytophagaceae bacterium SJW1-29]MPR37150.1 hypothetical protein [Cytophagaceae bacterium SJW1-29]